MERLDWTGATAGMAVPAGLISTTPAVMTVADAAAVALAVLAANGPYRRVGHRRRGAWR